MNLSLKNGELYTINSKKIGMHYKTICKDKFHNDYGDYGYCLYYNRLHYKKVILIIAQGDKDILEYIKEDKKMYEYIKELMNSFATKPYYKEYYKSILYRLFDDQSLAIDFSGMNSFNIDKLI